MYFKVHLLTILWVARARPLRVNVRNLPKRESERERRNTWKINWWRQSLVAQLQVANNFSSAVYSKCIYTRSKIVELILVKNISYTNKIHSYNVKATNQPKNREESEKFSWCFIFRWVHFFSCLVLFCFFFLFILLLCSCLVVQRNC